jgi:hypothetical protein
MTHDDPTRGDIVLYQTDDGRTRIRCRFEDQSLWLTQALIAELFDKDVRTVSEHLNNIYDDAELTRDATIRKFRIVRQEGARQVSRDIEHYSLPAILAVGYRVRSARGTQFRQWATARLEEFLIKGFCVDDERLKNPKADGVADYFDELLERIRDIRASERRMYLRVLDLLALAADYRPDAKDAVRLFQSVQNKLHFAVTGMTAPELIVSRANATQPNMGLTSWSGMRVRRADAKVAKNYLRAEEISELNRIVVMFLDYAEDQTRRRKQLLLSDWQNKVDDFLRFHERNVLPSAGAVSRESAELKADEEFEVFAARRRADAEDEGERDVADRLDRLAEELRNRPRDPKKPDENP